MSETPLKDYFQSKIDSFYSSPKLKERILGQLDLPENRDYKAMSERAAFEKIFQHFIEEAELSLSLLKRAGYTREKKILEVGGGIGLLYAYLKEQGYDIYALEPSESGFAGYYESALELFATLGTNASAWYPYLAEEADKINKTFDIIFSNNVFEHIPDLRHSLLALKKTLRSDGVMIHNTVNYHVPYEPHFKIFLVPFFPSATAALKPALKSSTLWRGLNFITTSSLRRLCRDCGLRIEFEHDVMQKAFLRLESDPEFASRQKLFIPILRFLKFTGLIRFLNIIPVSLTTPIIFRLYQRL